MLGNFKAYLPSPAFVSEVMGKQLFYCICFNHVYFTEVDLEFHLSLILCEKRVKITI